MQEGYEFFGTGYSKGTSIPSINLFPSNFGISNGYLNKIFSSDVLLPF